LYNAPVVIAPIIVFHNNGKFSTGLWKSQTVGVVVWLNGDNNRGIFVSFALLEESNLPALLLLLSPLSHRL
jgi:hypothetical protein